MAELHFATAEARLRFRQRVAATADEHLSHPEEAERLRSLSAEFGLDADALPKPDLAERSLVAALLQAIDSTGFDAPADRDSLRLSGEPAEPYAGPTLDALGSQTPRWPHLTMVPPEARYTALNPVIPAHVQHDTLQESLDRVSALAAQGLIGQVVIDLDLTSLLPTERSTAAALAAGQQFNVPELLRPLEEAPFIPGYTVGAFRRYVELLGLRDAYPGVEWGYENAYDTGGGGARGVYAAYRGRYWGNVASDSPSPGIADYARRVKAAGGIVVFDSARGGPGGIAEAFAKDGLTVRFIEPEQLGEALAEMRADPTGGADALVIVGHAGGSDQEVKASRQRIQEEFGPVVAVMDDRKANREARIAASANPDAIMSVAVAAPGYSYTEDAESGLYRISNFLLNPPTRR